MSIANDQHLPNPPSQPIREEDIGRKVIGPFKRHVANTTRDAREWIRHCEKWLQEYACDSESQPSEEDVENMQELLKGLHQHRSNLRAIPQLMEAKLSIPTIRDCDRLTAIVDDVTNYVAKSDYARLITRASNTIGMFEQEFNARQLPLHEISSNVYASENMDTTSVNGDDDVESRGGTPDSAIQQMEYIDETVYGNGPTDMSYLHELERKVAAMEAEDKQLPSVTDPAKKAPAQGEGTVSGVLNANKNNEQNTRIFDKVKDTAKPQNQSQTSKPTFAFSPPEDVSRTPHTAKSPPPTQHHSQSQPEWVDLLFKRIDRLEKEKESDSSQFKSFMHEVQSQLSEKRNPKPMEPQPSKSDKKFMPTRESEMSDESELGEEYTESDSSYYSKTHKSRKAKSNKRHSRLHSSRPKGMKLESVRQNLISFNGTGRLDNFRELFKELVLDNPQVNDRMKAVLLEQNLKGPAANHMQHMTDPVETVIRTFYELEQVFGQKTDRMELKEKFASLPFHQTDCEKMVTDLAAHRSIINLLKDKNVNVNDDGIIATFSKKLPKCIQDKILKRLSRDRDSGVTFDQVLLLTKEHIDLLKMRKAMFGESKTQGSNEIDEFHTSIHYSNTQPRQQNHQNQHSSRGLPQGTPNSRVNSGQRGTPQSGGNRKGKGSQLMAPKSSANLYKPGTIDPKWNIISWSFPFKAPEVGVTCGACNGAHNPIRCPLSSIEFQKRLREKKLCERCTLSDHSTEQCQKWYTCGYCHGDHSMGGCPQKEFYRNPANLPSTCKIKTSGNQKRSFRNGSSIHSQ